MLCAFCSCGSVSSENQSPEDTSAPRETRNQGGSGGTGAGASGQRSNDYPSSANNAAKGGASQGVPAQNPPGKKSSSAATKSPTSATTSGCRNLPPQLVLFFSNCNWLCKTIFIHSLLFVLRRKLLLAEIYLDVEFTELCESPTSKKLISIISLKQVRKVLSGTLLSGHGAVLWEKLLRHWN